MLIRACSIRSFTAVAITMLALTACTGSDPGPDITSGPAVLSAADIRGILSGKSWRFAGPNNTGTTL